MRKRVFATLFAVISVIAAGALTAPSATASAADGYTGTHFGVGNIPPGCENDTFTATDNACYHMRTGMNGLDSSDVDVLLMVPASPTATRDMRIMRQAVEMWNGGIHYLAPQMGVPWMKNMHFKISTDIESAAAGQGIVTYPIVDPEIVVVATNPVGGAGIGIDPWATEMRNLGQNPETPCTGVSNPFDLDTWKGMPGYDHHDHEPGATVTERCPNGGGNVCFALTPAIDPDPPALDVFNLFDLVAHEFGHCLTIGHVGDGAEGPWSKVPTNDIMSYNTDPPGLNKCVSTLDVEGIAVTQSHYIDTNHDGVVNDADHVDANQASWDTTSDHFQAQNPRDHFYASGTGAPTDCPQPDLGLLPGTPTNWQPTQVQTTNYNLDVTGPADGASSADGAFDVLGTVERASTTPAPTATSGKVADSQSDAHTNYTEIKSLSAAVTPTAVQASIGLKKVPPTSTMLTSPTVYSLEINGRRFDSFVRYPKIDPGPMTWDNQAAAYLPNGTSKWFSGSPHIEFTIPRSYLAGVGITAPYFVDGLASAGVSTASQVDDRAPEGRNTIGLAAAKGPSVASPSFRFAPRTALQTVTFNHDGGNVFYADQSTGGVLTGSPVDQSHHFTLNLPSKSDVTFSLDWTDTSPAAASDLDLYVTGAADSGSTAASSNKPEVVSFNGVKGELDIAVDPYLVDDEANGVTYTLTAVVNSTPVVDSDGDGVPDDSDACPNQAGNGADGCPTTASLEQVLVYVDGVLAGSNDVDTAGGPDSFDVPVTVPAGDHTLRIDWSYYGKVVASTTRQVSR
ncbi:MAG TPA: hypothetical protein VHD87_18020 [Acidimicrobiales bacterium]|nr:hypothetical protein [Acidimicrobiales bacterium]